MTATTARSSEPSARRRDKRRRRSSISNMTVSSSAEARADAPPPPSSPSRGATTSSSSTATSTPSTGILHAVKDGHGRRMPKAIAHRGYKTAHPENTMRAFVGAVKVGAHAIETDLHLSKDGVVVLSHDPTLKRCFRPDEKIIDCDWEYLSKLRTLEAPHEPMPRLADLLQYLTLPAAEEIVVFLDIKVSCDQFAAYVRGSFASGAEYQSKLLNNDSIADDVMKEISRTIDEVPSPRPWRERLIVGFWAAKYLPLCEKYFPRFPYVHIGSSPTYARQFFKEPQMAFSILQMALMGPFGWLFMRDVKARHLALFIWTVNKEETMLWCIRKEVDGVITDDPKKFLEICDRYHEGGLAKRQGFSAKSWATILWYNLMTLVYGVMFRYRARPKREQPRR